MDLAPSCFTGGDMNAAPKRGRPPRTFLSSRGTEMTLREMGITRQFASNAMAIASLPDDVFEAAINADDIPSIRALVNRAKGLPPGHRAGSPFTEAMRHVQRLSPADRRALCIAILTADETAEIFAVLTAQSAESLPHPLNASAIRAATATAAT